MTADDRITITEVADSDATAEAESARKYWASHPIIDYYKEPQPQAEMIAELVAGLVPAETGTVFEFGCNVGRNLHTIRSHFATLRRNVGVFGIDINSTAIAEGRQHFGFTEEELQVGDDRRLASLPTGSFDVSFTVSVIDHLAQPADAVRELVRISRRAVVMLELDLGQVGKVSGTVDGHDVVGYSYSYNYPELFAAAGAEIERNEPVSLGIGVLANYRLLIAGQPGGPDEQARPDLGS